MIRPTQWHFWCHGCKAEKNEDTDGSLGREAELALAWYAEHDGHGLGGFVEPIPSIDGSTP